MKGVREFYNKGFNLVIKRELKLPNLWSKFSQNS